MAAVAPVLGVILAGGLARRMGGGDKPLVRLGGRTLLDRVHERFAPQCPAGVILSANGDPARFSGFPGAIVADGVPGHPGPLAGILAALDHAAVHHLEATHVASVTGDAPFLPGDLVARLGAALIDHPSRDDDQRAFPPPSAGEGGPRVSEGRERGALSPAPSLPSPDPLCGPPSPAKGRGSARLIAMAASGGRQHFTVALWGVSLRHDLRTALVEREERRVGAFLARHGAVAVEWPAEPVDPFLNINTPEDLALAQSLIA